MQYSVQMKEILYQFFTKRERKKVSPLTGICSYFQPTIGSLCFFFSKLIHHCIDKS